MPAGRPAAGGGGGARWRRSASAQLPDARPPPAGLRAQTAPQNSYT